MRFCRRRFLLAGVVSLFLVLILAVHIAGLRLVCSAIVRSPNAGKSVAPATPLAQGVDGVITVDVGPPPARLSAWMMNPPNRDGRPAAPIGTVVVAHGIHSNKRDMLGVGRLLADAGFRAVLVDLRGHGDSTGDTLSFGVNESRDLSQVVDELEQNGWVAGGLGVYGASFGGATALMLAGRDSRVKAVVAVCPFSSMREIVPQYVRSYVPAGRLLPDWWIQLAVSRAGQLAGFDPDQASPVRAIASTRAHALVIHGRADLNIPFSQAQAIAAAAPDRTRLILLEGEDHASIMQDRSGTIARESIALFKIYLGGTERPARSDGSAGINPAARKVVGYRLNL